MLTGLQAIGWLLRRTPDQARLGGFYQNILGLPHIRQHDATPVFWLGETVVFGVNKGGKVLEEVSDPAAAPCVPVLGVAGIDGLVARLTERGVRFLGPIREVPNGRRAFFFDLDNNLMTLQERSSRSDWPEDVAARARWDAGRVQIPDAPLLAGGYQHLCRVVFHCEDVERETAYFERIGLPLRRKLADRAYYAIGEVVTLEIAPGAGSRGAPADRAEENSSFVLRVADVDAAAAELRSKGVVFVNDPFDIGGGRVGYFADPEGHVLGIQTRWPSSERVEDREARRRVAAGELPS
jgi:predicted enzyme related to lactoylglutathione lyase